MQLFLGQEALCRIWSKASGEAEARHDTIDVHLSEVTLTESPLKQPARLHHRLDFRHDTSVFRVRVGSSGTDSVVQHEFHRRGVLSSSLRKSKGESQQ